MGKVTDNWTPEGKRFMKELRELEGLEVRIGYQREQGSGKQQDEENQSENKKPPADLIDIAMWNEFGTEHIPSRPFMRDSVDKHIPAIEYMLKAQEDAFLNGASARKVLENVGIFQKDLVQTEIDQGDFVPNAESTIAKKSKKGPGPYKPLIDTGDMRKLVNFWIQKKGSDR